MRAPGHPLILGFLLGALSFGCSSSRSLSGVGERGGPQAVVPVVGESNPDAAVATSKRADEAYVALPIRDVTIELDDNPDYEGMVVYPQLEGATTPEQRAFNRYVDQLARREVGRFKTLCQREAARRKERDTPLGFGLRASYDISYASPELVSLTLTWASFTGYVNEDYSTTPITFDLERGRLVQLRDLFRRGSTYLEPISAFCVAELKATHPELYPDVPHSAGKRVSVMWDLDKNAGPRPENYHTWNVTERGLEITFGEYQVGPGMLGLVTVLVPYEKLADVADPRGPLARAVSARVPAPA
jgi:hypothetical protein